MTTSIPVDQAATVDLDTKPMICEVICDQQLACWVFKWRYFSAALAGGTAQDDLGPAEVVASLDSLVRAVPEERASEFKNQSVVGVVDPPNRARFECFAGSMYGQLIVPADINFELNFSVRNAGGSKRQQISFAVHVIP